MMGILGLPLHNFTFPIQILPLITRSFNVWSSFDEGFGILIGVGAGLFGPIGPFGGRVASIFCLPNQYALELEPP
jgi:hypothetical protein